MIRSVTVVAIASALVASGALGLTRDGDDPAGDGARPPTGPAAVSVADPRDLDASIAALQDHLRRVPGDAPGWATLALASVEQARLTGDATTYERADRAVARSLAEQPDDNAAAWAAAGALASARHDFSEALEHARTALAVDPFDAGALAIRVDALTELGRYPAQLRALRVADRRQPGTPVVTRYAYAYELRGRLDDAAAVLRPVTTAPSPADRVFAHTLLADVERRRGHLDRAGRHLRAALRTSPGHVPAMVGLARLAVARGDLDRAEGRWQAVVRRLPLPEYLTELGELHLHLGRDADADAQFAVVRTTLDLLADRGVNTDLEAALFEADHGSVDSAVAMAQDEWRRRQSVQVADALAWALHARGDDRRALRLARRATRLGTSEARLWVHRGLIEVDRGLDRAARRHLVRGLRTDPGLSPWLADRAADALRSLEDEA